MSGGNQKTTGTKGYPPSGNKSKRETNAAAANSSGGKVGSRESQSNKDGAKKSTVNNDKKGAQSIKSSTKSKGKGGDDSSMQSNLTDTESGKNGTDSSSDIKETGPTDTGSNQDTDETGPTDTGSNQPTDETRETDRTTDESKKSTEPDPSKSDSSLTTDASSKDKTTENDLEAAVEYVEGFIKDKVFGHEATKLVESIKTLHKNRVDPAKYQGKGKNEVDETEEIFEVTKEVLAEDLFSHAASFKRILEKEGHKLEEGKEKFKDKEKFEDKDSKKDKKEDKNKKDKNEEDKKSERKYSAKKRKDPVNTEKNTPEEEKKSYKALKDLTEEGRKLVYFDKDIILFTNNIKEAKVGEFIQLIAFPNDLKLKSIRSLKKTKSHIKFLNELENLKEVICTKINKEKSDPKLKEKDVLAKFDYYPERYWLNCKFSLKSEGIIYGQHVRDLDKVSELLENEEKDEKLLFEGELKADLVIKKRIHLAAMYIHSFAEENKELDKIKNNLKNFSKQVWKKFEGMRDSLETEGKEPDHIRNCKYLFLTSMTIYALTKNFKFEEMDFVMRDKLKEVYEFIEKKYSDSVKAEETEETAVSSKSSKSEITYI